MSPTPAYPRIAEALRAAIATGELPNGSRVPSEPTLAARFSTARNTVRRALAELQREGLIATVPGKGRIVRNQETLGPHQEETMPGYQRIASVLRQQIQRGVYPAGGRLPSEAALACQHRVSRETARRALAILRSEGQAVAIHGKGWFAHRDVPGMPRTSQDVPDRVSQSATQSP